MNQQDIGNIFTFRKLANVFLATVIGCAFAGFFVGVTEEHKPVLPEEDRITEKKPLIGKVEPAVSYTELRELERGPNKDWSSHLKTLEYEIPSVTDTVPTPELQQKLAALEERASRRAYHGAPPMVPHGIDQRSSESCLVCHGREMRIEGQIVPKISHPHYQNCLQCHAEMQNFVLGAPPKLASNAFDGLDSPVEGSRAWPGAPPTMPHSTHMRNDCQSCHGVNGRLGLRTTHPERRQCLQCHAPSADLDQQPKLKRPPVFAAFAQENP